MKSEEDNSKLQYLEQYYHLIGHRSKSIMSETARYTWRDTDSDIQSTVLKWVMKLTQVLKGQS